MERPGDQPRLGRSSLAPWVFKFVLSWAAAPANSLAVTVNGEALQAATALGLGQTDGKVRHTVEHAGLAWAAADDTLLTQALGRLGGTAVTLVSASRALTVAEAGLVLLDATAGPVTVTLPLAAALAGVRYDLVRVDGTANAVTIQRAGSDVIDGGTSVTLAAQYATRALRSNGVSAWYTVAGIPATTGRAGVIRTATDAEAAAGVVSDAALTPHGLAAVLPVPAAGALRLLAVATLGSTGDSSTNSTSFQTTGVSGWYTRARPAAPCWPWR